MTEPSQPTITVVERPPAEEVVETQPIPNAPSFVVCAPHHGSTDVTVAWGAPNEGPADSYLIEIAGASLEVPGTATEVVVTGLPAGQAVTANVTAKYKSRSTTNASLATLEDPAVATYDEAAQPAVDQVPADVPPQEA